MPRRRTAKVVRIQIPLLDKKFVARGKLFDALRHGKIKNIDEAERIAAKRGLGPLYQAPHQSLFDPTRLSRWNLSMSVAWIAWRELDRVRDADSEYRRKCSDWIFRCWRVPGFKTYEGWFLEQRNDMTISDLAASVIYRGKTGMLHGVSEAQELLWSAAGEGQITGEGIRARDNAVVEIPNREWRFLRATEHRKKEVLALDHTGEVTYSEVAFPRWRLLELWPPLNVNAPPIVPTDKRPKARDVKWAIEELFSDHPSPLSLSKGQRREVMNLLNVTKCRICPASDEALKRMLQRLRKESDKDI